MFVTQRTNPTTAQARESRHTRQPINAASAASNIDHPSILPIGPRINATMLNIAAATALRYAITAPTRAALTADSSSVIVGHRRCGPNSGLPTPRSLLPPRLTVRVWLKGSPSMLNIFKKVFITLSKVLVRVFKVAQDRGLTDDIVNRAEGLVGEAQKQFNDNDARREWAVAALIAAKVPESIARLAIELAVQVFKSKAARTGLDPVSWTSFLWGIRCPDRWQTRPSAGPAGDSMTTSRPRLSGSCSTRGESVGSVARDLDLTETALREWVNRARADRTKGKTGLTTAEREELARLRRENRILQEEREILKKAAAFFAKHQR
jgi:transposase